MFRSLLITAALLVAAPAPAATTPPDPVMPALPDLRTQASVRDAIVSARLDTLIPKLMRQNGVAMWILIAREYNEDPVVKTMLPATWTSARRRTVLIFHDKSGPDSPDGAVERLAVARYPVGDFKPDWDPEVQPDQWARIAEIVRERDPATIAINTSSTFALADGLTMTQHRELIKALGPEFASRLVSHDGLALGWLETRIPTEMALYRTIMRAAHSLIPEGLSEKVITPGVTSTQDVVWWYRERLADLRLDAWCQPSVSIQRQAQPTFAVGTMSVANRPGALQTITPGDLLHVDFCAGTLALKTDTQQMAYVLKPGETAAPAGLTAGLHAANKVQDALTSSYAPGLTGNQLLKLARDKAIAQGLEPNIYTHPIGLHGHAAGPSIGYWDDQSGSSSTGNAPVNPDTAWSIELSAVHAVPEWGGQKARFMLEVDAFFDGKTVRYIDGRQTELLLIPRNPN